jgi:cyclopropane fatty-acyl-phospholipid synthase-like methyltransferase
VYDWEEAYQGTPPWDIGFPQPAIEELVSKGELKPGRDLDLGCGRGENSIMMAKNSFKVTGIDLVKAAIDSAISKAAEQHLKIDFMVGNVLELDRKFAEKEFDAVIDCGLFHVMTDEERPVLAKQIHRVIKPGGNYFMICFSDREPGTYGPRRVSKKEIEQTFSSLFKIIYIRDAFFASWADTTGRKAYILSAVRI